MGCDESKPCPAALVQTQVVSEMRLNSHSSEIMKEIGLILVVVGIVEIGRYLINKNKKQYTARVLASNLNLNKI
jgi:hypothetical protein